MSRSLLGNGAKSVRYSQEMRGVTSNTAILQKVRVDFTYPVVFSRDIFALDNPSLKDVLDGLSSVSLCKVLIFIDDGVVKNHDSIRERITEYFASISVNHPTGLRLCDLVTVRGGETCKNDLELVERVLTLVDEHSIDRHSVIIAIGGGAVIDAVGFAAATAHRGVRHIRIPSTVLSQNDSGLGVKNGINRFGKKNFQGVFCPPNAVVNDANLLETLEDRDWLGGVSEAVKVVLLKDPEFFREMEEMASAIRDRNLDAMERVVLRCAELHLEHIATSGDPFEQGSSRPLDFGHWSAHKLESLSNYKIRHGEAVAIGLSLDCVYSHLQGWLRKGELDRILGYFDTIGLATSHNLLSAKSEDGYFTIMKGLEEFREHLGGRLTLMMLQGVGQPLEVNDVNPELMVESINYLLKRNY